MSTNPDLDDFVVRPISKQQTSVPILRIQQKTPLVFDSTPTDSFALDAFQRSRVSNPVTLFESSMEVDRQSLLWNDVATGSGASTYNTNQASVSLNTVAISSSFTRTSRQYMRYQPGKSLMVLASFVLGARATGVTRRVGYFDDNNGIYLEQTGDDIAWVVRTSTSGAPVNTRVVQASWNLDVFNGTGTSTLTLSEANANIAFIDLEWLGVGRVRVGFVVNGRIYYVHQFINLGVTMVYMSRASLPVRYSVASSGAASGSSSLVQICSTVISEGGFVPRGMIRATGNGTTTRTVAAGSYLPLVAIRLKSGYTRAALYPISVQVGNNSGTMSHVQLLVRLTSLTGGAWTSVSEAVEANITATATTGGYVVAESYTDKNVTIASLEIQDATLVNASDATGVADIIAVQAESFSGNIQVSASIQWREIF
jgi:hypothetical protein